MNLPLEQRRRVDAVVGELPEVLRIGMQAAAGLAAAHDQGLVHRDVKPANIFLEMGVERVVTTHFGLARAVDDVSMTRQGVVAGTPEYMSPEQARGEPLAGRSDLFSLGCVPYEMATGVPPFRTDSTVAMLRRVVDEQPPAMASLVPELPPWFCHIIERLLSKDPAQRFTSASEVSMRHALCASGRLVLGHFVEEIHEQALLQFARLISKRTTSALINHLSLAIDQIQPVGKTTVGSIHSVIDRIHQEGHREIQSLTTLTSH